MAVRRVARGRPERQRITACRTRCQRCELLAAGRPELEHYGGLIARASATAARRAGGGFEVSTGDGEPVSARRLVVTTVFDDATAAS